jgi:hypothetical protein
MCCSRVAAVNNVHVQSVSWQADHKHQPCRLQLPCRTMQQEAHPAVPSVYPATSPSSCRLNTPLYTVHTGRGRRACGFVVSCEDGTACRIAYAHCSHPTLPLYRHQQLHPALFRHLRSKRLLILPRYYRLRPARLYQAEVH